VVGDLGVLRKQGGCLCLVSSVWLVLYSRDLSVDAELAWPTLHMCPYSCPLQQTSVWVENKIHLMNLLIAEFVRSFVRVCYMGVRLARTISYQPVATGDTKSICPPPK
jgi:hypothetical protein